MIDATRVAVDSCVFVNVLVGGEPAHPEWLRAGRQLFQAAQDGQFDVCIASLTIAEVCGSGGARGSNIEPQRRSQNITAARQWVANGRFRVVELDRSLAAEAAQLAIDLQLKGPDAVVLASAKRAGAHTLFSWDGDLLKVDGRVDSLRVITPADAMRQSLRIFSLRLRIHDRHQAPASLGWSGKRARRLTTHGL